MLQMEFYRGFQDKADRVKNDFLAFLIDKKRAGSKVVGYGAAAKGNTLLNYAGVKVDLLNYVVDASPHKQGRFLPGSHIPVVDESRIRVAMLALVSQEVLLEPAEDPGQVDGARAAVHRAVALLTDELAHRGVQLPVQRGRLERLAGKSRTSQ